MAITVTNGQVGKAKREERDLTKYTALPWSDEMVEKFGNAHIFLDDARITIEQLKAMPDA